MSVVSGTTRALACLALGHDDAEEPRCAASDEDLVRQLVEEVQRLRVAAGIVEESSLDREERIEVVAEVLADAAGDDSGFGIAIEVLHVEYPDEPDEQVLARFVLDRLDASGWTLHPIARP